jgi:periplasmic protein TonB
MQFGTDGSSRTGNRVVGLVFVIGFHILLVWGLMNGLARKAVQLLPAPIETKIIEDIKPPAEEPPPPKPEFEPPPPAFIPPPEINIAAPVQATTAITQTTPVKPEAPPVVAPKPMVRIAPKIDLKNSPRACKEPEYPAASERLGESGTSAISLLISAAGSVDQTRIDSSSGFKRLDDAAIKAFSRCKFIVGTNDGVPEASWFSIRYKWVVPR